MQGTTVKRRFHPWRAVMLPCDNYTEVNVAAALRDENSVFYTYQKLIALRKTQPVLIWGDYQILPDSPSVWCYRRQWQGQAPAGCRQSERPVPSGIRRISATVAGATAIIASQPASRDDARPFEAIWWLQR